MLQDMEFRYVVAGRNKLALQYRKKFNGVWTDWFDIKKEEECE